MLWDEIIEYFMKKKRFSNIDKTCVNYLASSMYSREARINRFNSYKFT